MSTDITLSEIRSSSDLPRRSDCEENGCKLRLDDMSHREAFEPDAVDSGESRADCCIFFPKEVEDSDPLYRHEEETSTDPTTDYTGIIEIKSTLSKPEKIKQQLKGALDCAVDILKRCDDPPWGMKFFAIVVHDSVRTPYKTIRNKRVACRVNGRPIVLNPVPVDHGSVLKEEIETEQIKEAMFEL